MQTKIHLLALAAIVALAACGKDDKAQKESTLQIAQETMQEVMPVMIKTLSDQVNESGAAKSVAFCNEFAGNFGREKNAALKEKFMAEKKVADFRFFRKSDKNRNPANAPSAEQAAVLKEWQSAVEIKPAVFKNGDVYTAMLPIKIVSPLCLKCHGPVEQMEPAVAGKIRELYPQDLATGYELNQLRGAFVVEVKY